MIRKLNIFIYYFFIQHLPHSRFLKLSNRIRCWYVCRVLGIMQAHPKNYFEPNIYIGSGQTVRIGKHCQINENIFIQDSKIGNHVMIAPGVVILSKSHRFDSVAKPMIQQGETETMPVTIKDDVWIGRNAIILPGVVIERGCIIAAGSVVTENTQPFTIVGGVPAKIIKSRI